MALHVTTMVAIAGFAAGAVGAIVAARRGKDGKTVAAAGGLMATVAAIGFFVTFALARPEQRAVQWGVLCLFVAGLAAVAVGVLADHWEKLRQRWTASGGAFGLREVAKGHQFWFMWLLCLIGTGSRCVSQGRPISQWIDHDVPALGVMVILYSVLLSTDLCLVRRWSRERAGGDALPGG
ncbi:MAG TPA: hypothetical protein VGM37_20950 [Armatimonadota bacterium]|jgi:hypothetical protein